MITKEYAFAAVRQISRLEGVNTTEPTKRTRGRVPTFDHDEALEIALDLFWRHGYEGVSVAELCRAIGIAAPSLYHAFGSKADLYRDAVRLYRATNMTAEDVASASSARSAALDMLRRGVAAVTRPGRPLGCMVSSGLLMVGVDGAELAEELQVLRAELRKALEQRIIRDVNEGALPATTDPATVARFYATILQGLSVQAVDGATRAELDAVVRAAMHAWPAC